MRIKKTILGWVDMDHVLLVSPSGMGGREVSADIVCRKCKNAGKPITRIVTFCPYDAPNVYRVEHFCDQYLFPEARKYLHGKGDRRDA